MNRKRFGIAMIAALLLASPAVVLARNRGPCSLEGNWITRFGEPPQWEPLLIQESLIPVDPAGMKLSYTAGFPNPGLFMPFAPNTDSNGLGIGTFVRTGPRVYKFTIIAHAAEALPQGTPGRALLRWFWVYSGTAECLDDNTMVKKGTFAIFSFIDVPEMGIHDQDKDRDGFPDPGELPIQSLPWELIAKRVRVQEPYPVTP